MRRTRSLTILMITIAVGLAGCASNGGTAALKDPEKLHQIHVNKSTKQQVKEILVPLPLSTPKFNEVSLP